MLAGCSWEYEALVSAQEPELIVAPVGKHSVKPDEVWERIEALFDGPYLRTVRPATIADPKMPSSMRRFAQVNPTVL
jgi:hypothetical protein